MRVLVTGANGMLGTCLANTLSHLSDLYLTSRGPSLLANEEFNYLSSDLAEDDLSILINWAQPDVIIHCAALTNVVSCESDPFLTYKTNSDPIKKLIDLAPNSKFIFISSDAVYGDEVLSDEKSPSIPSTIYAKSKVKAENYMNFTSGNHLSIRTTIVGTRDHNYPTNFVDWLINSLVHVQPVNLYTNNYFSPISIWDLANEIKFLLTNWIYGVYNVSGNFRVSKHIFGLRLAEALRLDTSCISPKLLSSGSSITPPRILDQSISSQSYADLTSRPLPTLSSTINSIVANINL